MAVLEEDYGAGVDANVLITLIFIAYVLVAARLILFLAQKCSVDPYDAGRARRERQRAAAALLR